MKTTVTIHCDACNKFRNLKTDGTDAGFDAAKRAHLATCGLPKLLPVGEAIQAQKVGVMVDPASLTDTIRAEGKGWIGGVYVVRSLARPGAFMVTKSVYTA